MKKFENFVFVVMVALVLTACEGGGSNATPAQTKEVVDVTFVNVPTNPNKTSVIPGERDVEVAAFRMIWNDVSHSPIGQLVFKNQSPEKVLWRIFKGSSFRLVDDDNNDVGYGAQYNLRVDDERHEVTIDFFRSPWFPRDSGVVPKTYSLLVSMDVTAAEGMTFAFELAAVQMHDAGKVAVGEVKGRQFNVANVTGMSLPTLTTTSSESIAVVDGLVGKMIPMINFSSSCPAENTEPCFLTEIQYFAVGMSEPILGVDGMLMSFSQRDNPDNYTFTAPVGWYAILPGQTKSFTIFATAYQSSVILSIADMEWVIGKQQTKVSPIAQRPKG